MSRKKGHGAPSHERWLISYADFVTLIFALFVVLFASARADHKRQADMSAAMHAAFTEMGIFAPAVKTPPLAADHPGRAARDLPLAPPVDMGSGAFAGTPAQRTNLLALKKNLETVLAGEIRQGTVALRLSRDGLVISLMEMGFFDSGSAVYKPSSAPTIRRIAEQLKTSPNSLRVEGHTDDVPIHSAQFASNWELSTARATTLARILIGEYGYDPARLSAAGYAQYHPAAANTDEKGRALNRRVDLVVLPIPVWNTPKPTTKRR